MLIFALACAEPCPSPERPGSVQAGPLHFDVEPLQERVCGPAFAVAADLDDDGFEEAVVSTFGRMRTASVPNGSLRAYDGEGAVTWLLREEQGFKWPNGASPHDMDGDGDVDLVVGLGFLTCQMDPFTQDCGGLLWLENPSWEVHELVAPGADGFYHHAELADLDGDGHPDLVTANESQATPMGTSAGSEVQVFWGPDWEQQALAPGLGSFIHARDLDSDGDLDLMGASFWGVEGQGYSWLENADGWPEHAIDADSGPAIQLSPVDLDGLAAIGSNHVGGGDAWAPTLALYRPDEDVTQPWHKTVLSTDFLAPSGVGAAAPGVFDVGDIDGDGDLDVLLSGDGDGDIHWLEQDGDAWRHHLLDSELPQAGVALVDFDGDGQPEPVVSSWEANLVLRYTLR